MESSLPPLHSTRIHLTHTIKHIDLRWGDDLRVDPLTEDLAVVASSYEETRTDTEGHRVAESGFFLPRWPSKWPLAVRERSLVCVCASP